MSSSRSILCFLSSFSSGFGTRPGSSGQAVTDSVQSFLHSSSELKGVTLSRWKLTAQATLALVSALGRGAHLDTCTGVQLRFQAGDRERGSGSESCRAYCASLGRGARFVPLKMVDNFPSPRCFVAQERDGHSNAVLERSICAVEIQSQVISSSRIKFVLNLGESCTKIQTEVQTKVQTKSQTNTRAAFPL